ncbi:MAG: dockerin type I domain-containing protein [Euryarchaeota archaeon]|nr:dockerin type I domain-containing protein [Euryarchaeota archaeon]
MNKALIVAIATVGIIVSVQIGFAATTSTGSQTGLTINVEPPYLSVSQGDTFTVNIVVDPDGTEIAGVDYILRFDNAVLNVLSQNKGQFLGGDIMVNITDNLNGSVDYGEYRKDSSGVTDPGVLTTIEFEAISTGISEFHFEHVLLSDPDGSRIRGVAICNGRVGIDQPPSSFMICGHVFNEDESVCNNPAVTITNLNTCMEWVDVTAESSNYYRLVLASCGDVIANDTLRFNATSPDGCIVTEYTVTRDDVTAGGFEHDITPEFCPPGDVNGDGKITSADAAIVLQMAVCGDNNKIADVNGDGSVTSLDALIILQAAANNIDIS